MLAIINAGASTITSTNAPPSSSSEVGALKVQVDSFAWALVLIPSHSKDLVNFMEKASVDLEERQRKVA
ncbi:hypothetical protein AMTR_s00098p00096330 [Amborella trichopoda]|uniref:Uncharacterized protein n=1 Tax=Amborella trichopoda TaxID=13333 RepID=W1NS49_AMBTC|nr:hypothetical protein AMTR_s00098p00096330 [Amborella trichopoda]